MNDNQTLIQFFEWNYPEDGSLWTNLKERAKELKKLGVTMVWMPPAYKGAGGILDVGYGVYDLYDLGEFDQKETVRTKYGDKKQYLEAINELHKNGIKAIADVVFNQKMGADELEEVTAVEVSYENRNNEVSEPYKILTWTKFNFEGRKNKYSDFKWNHNHFDGVDWDEKAHKNALFKFQEKNWEQDVDSENGNFDYLMGADIDLNNDEVRSELEKWGKWYMQLTNVDGFRLDAIKHIGAGFFISWVHQMRNASSKELYVVGEYWNANIEIIVKYLEQFNYEISLFDVPLHYNFFQASNSNGEYDMRKIFDNTLTSRCPENSVTFVDNHDTVQGQALESEVQPWFKPLAYAIILLRSNGTPCVFYGDIYSEGKNPNKIIDIFMKIRKQYAYGEQIDYFDNENIVGWVRRGDDEHLGSGFAVLMSDNAGGCKKMYIGEKFANEEFFDITGNVAEIITIDSEGNGNFMCDGGSVSVWIKKANFS